MTSDKSIEPKKKIAQSKGLMAPQDEVVVIPAKDFTSLHGAQTGKALVDASQASPRRDIEWALAPSETSPVRDVQL